jgi:hypothetical protein
MKKIAALIGALLLTLVLAAPVAADQKMSIFKDVPFDFGPDEVFIADWDFECSGPIYYGSYGTESLDLWYAKGETRDLMPADGAWPWTKGQYRREGVDYFTDKAGLVASGKFTFASHLYDHYLGGIPDYTVDPETWTEKLAGKTWGIQIPGHGTVFHSSGNFLLTVTVTDQTPGAEVIVYEPLREWRGNETFDVEELCGFFGYGAVFPPPAP